MNSYKRLWALLLMTVMITFGLLGYYGKEVYRQAPPIPDKITTASGKVLMTQDSILDGQTAWQSVGGMQLGSIWGHGAYAEKLLFVHNSISKSTPNLRPLYIAVKK